MEIASEAPNFSPIRLEIARCYLWEIGIGLRAWKAVERRKTTGPAAKKGGRAYPHGAP